MTFDNKNRGFIRKNDRKQSEKSPDYTGVVNVEGQEYWLSAWLAEHQNMGGKYFQISVKKKDFTPAKEAARSAPEPSTPEDFSDQIPFMPVMDVLIS